MLLAANMQLLMVCDEIEAEVGCKAIESGAGNRCAKIERKPSGERRFLTLQEAAGELGCTRRFLEERIEDGEIRVFKPSTHFVRISRDEWNRWIEFYSHGGRHNPG